MFGIILIAAILRFTGIGFGFPAPDARPDEELVLREALFFYDGDPHIHFHFYPPGMTAMEIAWFGAARVVGLLPELSLESYAREPWRFHHAARIMAALLSLGAIAFVFGAGRRIAGDRGAAFGALALALAPLHVMNSHFGTLDPVGVFFFTASLYATVRLWGEPERARFAFFAALAAGMAAAVKYPHGAALFATVAVAIKARRVRALFAPAFFGTIAGFFILCPWLLWQWRDAVAGLRSQLGEQDVFGSAWQGESPALYHLRATLGHGFGHVALALAFFGMIAGRGRRVLTWPALILFGLHGFTGLVYPRYLLPVFPVLALFAAIACERICRGRYGTAITIALFAASVPLPLMNDIAFNRALGREDTRAEFLRAATDGRLPRDLPCLVPAWPFVNSIPLAWRTDEIRGFLNVQSIQGCTARAEIFRRTAKRLMEVPDPRPRPTGFTSITPKNDQEIARRFKGREVLLVIPESFDDMFRWYGEKRDEMLGYAASGAIEFKKILEIDPAEGRGFPPRSAYDRLDYWFVTFPDPSISPRPGPKITVYRFRVP